MCILLTAVQYIRYLLLYSCYRKLKLKCWLCTMCMYCDLSITVIHVVVELFRIILKLDD